MLLKSIIVLAYFSLVSANMFDFFQNQFQGGQENQVSFEDQVLENSCGKYLCPDTLKCVKGPKDCPCPFPSSQMKCILPNGQHVCISKPAGSFGGKYDDLEKNWKVDAKDDKVRDCGWVKRAWEGKI